MCMWVGWFTCRFEDLVLIGDERIPTLDFLYSCRAVVPFFGWSAHTHMRTRTTHTHAHTHKHTHTHMNICTLTYMYVDIPNTHTHAYTSIM